MLCALPRTLWWCQHKVSVRFNKGICRTHTLSNIMDTIGHLSLLSVNICSVVTSTAPHPELFPQYYLGLVHFHPLVITVHCCEILHMQESYHTVYFDFWTFPVGLTWRLCTDYTDTTCSWCPPGMYDKTIYMCLFHGEMDCPCYFTWDVLLPHSLKFPHINVREVRHNMLHIQPQH